MAAEKKPRKKAAKAKPKKPKKKYVNKRVFKPTGNKNFNRKPAQDDSLFVVRLMQQIRRIVKQIRTMKHVNGLRMIDIYAAFPNVHHQWIDDIAFYRIWRMLELEQSVPTHVRDVLLVPTEDLQSFMAQVGIQANPFEIERLKECRVRYQNYFMWGD
jgi:hypothetical protein